VVSCSSAAKGKKKRIAKKINKQTTFQTSEVKKKKIIAI